MTGSANVKRVLLQDSAGNYLIPYTDGGSGGNTDENFLPNGTTINVKLDGTGDFTSIKDAVDSLTGKWSNGKVTINIGTGTYIIDTTTEIDGTKFNIPALYIEGENNTNFTCNVNPIKVVNFSNYLKIDNLNGTSSVLGTPFFDINWSMGNIELANISTTSLDYLLVTRNSCVSIVGNMTITSATNGFLISHASHLLINNAATISMTNVTIGFNVIRASIVSSVNATYLWDNVPNKSNIVHNQYNFNAVLYVEGSF